MAEQDLCPAARNYLSTLREQSSNTQVDRLQWWANTFQEMGVDRDSQVFLDKAEAARIRLKELRLVHLLTGGDQ